VRVWRYRGYCPKCKRVRSERIEILSKESPHFTSDYSWWLGRLFEESTIRGSSRLMKEDEMTLWRLDYARMKRMLKSYKIPEVTHMSVDEVYARKKDRFDGEDRDQKFFTVISDLKTRKVIWVSESRKKQALDQFFLLLGSERCKKIEVVASDEHEGYAASIEEFCPKAIHVLDKFHILQNFENAVNDTRMMLHEDTQDDEIKRLSRGKFRFVFLQRANQRTKVDREHIESIIAVNKQFSMLEYIKERFLSFFYAKDDADAEDIFIEIGELVKQMCFDPLIKWWNKVDKKLDKFLRYFECKVTSALSEGINNVIKMLKRKAFGYRNMEYFRLKIMQKCGYLNSHYIPNSDALEDSVA
jgi:transposase